MITLILLEFESMIDFYMYTIHNTTINYVLDACIIIEFILEKNT